MSIKVSYGSQKPPGWDESIMKGGSTYTPPAGSGKIPPQTSSAPKKSSPEATSSASKQKEIECPFCTGQILAKYAGKAFASIDGFLQRNFSIKIPTEILTYLKENTPVSKKSAIKGTCKACGGKGSIKDPSDDSAKYEKAKAKAESLKEKIAEEEAKLGACGNRYTIIQGCDLLEVGLGMNDVDAHRVDKDKGKRLKGLAGPELIDTKKAGLQIPEGGDRNHVQGINPLASPGGHYVIKCSNRFSLLAGAQGVDITTGGAVNIHGGITQIIGAEVTVGSKTGGLLLEGDVVNINGRSIEIAPSDGHLVVKGTISSTGNAMVGGHAHFESVSFVKGETSGRNDTTKPSAPGDIITGAALWGGIAVEAGPAAVKDMLYNVAQNVSHPSYIQKLLSISGISKTSENMFNMTYSMLPVEAKPTGNIVPTTPVSIILTSQTLLDSTGKPCTGVLAGTVLLPIPLFNFPHNHVLPDLTHVHEVRVPDIDFSHDTHASVKGAQGGVSGSAPVHKTSTSLVGVATGLFSAIGSVVTGIMSGKTLASIRLKMGGG